MRGRHARPLTIDPRDVPTLQSLARSHSLSWFQVERARILLGVVNGQRVHALAFQMQCHPATVWRVCRDYEQRGLDAVLWEADRPGRPQQISPPPARSNRAVGLSGTHRQGIAYHALV